MNADTSNQSGSAFLPGAWDDGWRYDVEYVGLDADLAYWQSVLEDWRPLRVLELACGTGRITLPLAATGREQDERFRIIGLDYSASLLERAREKLAAESPAMRGAVTFVEGDMRNFQLDESFDLIILAFNSLAYLHTIDEQLGCLNAVRRHLAGGGRFAFDLLVPHHGFLAEAQTGVPPIRLEIDRAVESEGVVRFVRSCADRYDAMSQTITSTYFYEIYYSDGRQERLVSDLSWHMYYPRELLLLLHLSGLEPVEQYGDYRRAPFDSRSRRYLWTVAPVPADEE